MHVLTPMKFIVHFVFYSIFQRAVGLCERDVVIMAITIIRLYMFSFSIYLSFSVDYIFEWDGVLFRLCAFALQTQHRLSN